MQCPKCNSQRRRIPRGEYYKIKVCNCLSELTVATALEEIYYKNLNLKMGRYRRAKHKTKTKKKEILKPRRAKSYLR